MKFRCDARFENVLTNNFTNEQLINCARGEGAATVEQGDFL